MMDEMQIRYILLMQKGLYAIRFTQEEAELYFTPGQIIKIGILDNKVVYAKVKRIENYSDGDCIVIYQILGKLEYKEKKVYTLGGDIVKKSIKSIDKKSIDNLK